MYLGYLLTAESFAQNEIFTYTSVSSRLEEQYNAIHCHSSRFALALYSHPQLPLERRMQHTRFEEQKCTLVIVGRVYYTYGENETSDALPETLIQLYLKHGASFFDYLSGEFVCLLIDEKKKYRLPGLRSYRNHSMLLRSGRIRTLLFKSRPRTFRILSRQKNDGRVRRKTIPFLRSRLSRDAV